MSFIDPAKLTRDLGGKWMRSYGTAPCPICQTERRKEQNALTISERDGRLLMHCKKLACEFTDLLAASGIDKSRNYEVDLASIQRAQRERKKAEEKALHRAQSIWESGKPIKDTPAEAYLRARGITCALPNTLRWTPDIYHQPSGRYCTAMLASVSTGAIHRTFFDKKGMRLSNSAKMMLGPCSGGAVRLSDLVGPLVVTEGIETGLSLMSGLLDGSHSVWAALSTSGIKSLKLPDRPTSLVIATDGDPAGRAAGNDLAQRAHALGWEVSLMPAPDGKDWNDVLQEGVAV